MNLKSNEITALKNLLFRMADDDLILGHRNSEWTGLGPILEEDIAFSSMAQDKIGYAQAFYEILNKLGEYNPDILAFTRKAENFYCCQFVEYPIGEYDFSLMRHFLFDTAEYLRFEMLKNSSYDQLANAVKKFSGEVKYHIMHADVWISQLSRGNSESHERMQNVLDECFPLALGIFEPSEFENELKSTGFFEGEKILQERWLEKVTSVLETSELVVPDINKINPIYGGRKGTHTEYLQPLLDEMTEVFKIDPSAEW